MSDVRVVWLHALARSGSSVAVYAAAAPWGHVVADEVMGPWDRTGGPYNYPPSQKDLVELFKAEGHALTPAVVELAGRVFAELAGPSGVVVSKWPHLRPSPEEFDGAFPVRRSVYLIRNPLHRLNSLHKRGWTKAFGPKQDLDRYRQYAQWWETREHRVTFDEFKADPASFFRKLWDAWGFEHGEAELATALAYCEQNYHESSLKKSERPEGGIYSEASFALPREAIELYLNDPYIAGFMRERGWSVDPADYLD